MKYLILFILFAISIPSIAQHKVGVRAGLNYSKFSGELEEGENYSLGSGFHFGVNYTYLFNDFFGLRGELLYIQRGTKQSYFSEETYNFIRPPFGEKFVEFGEVDMNLEVSNAYLSIPITAQIELSRKFEVFGGLSLDFLVGPTGRGKIDFTSRDNPLDIFYIQSYDHRYGSDLPAQFNTISQQSIAIIVDGERLDIPKIVGAYYIFDSEEKTGKRFKSVDSHLILGANYFINTGFYIGVRAEYGLADITNNEMDISLTELGPENSFILRNDKDNSLNFSVSFGFRF